MPVEVEFFEEDKKFVVGNASDVSSLSKTYFGTPESAVLFLFPEEALYVLDVRNGKCLNENGKEMTFNEIAVQFTYIPRFITRYYAYKDWRDRGIVIRPIDEATSYSKCHSKKYPSPGFEVPKYNAKITFYPEDKMSVMDDNETAKLMYDSLWFGQFGTYKSVKHGSFGKLDIYETIFLAKYGAVKLTNYTWEQVMEIGKKDADIFEAVYNVYEDWRMRGFIVKTGFKFGTHFRIYFPGASPSLDTGDWVHSKHVVHVFPREMQLLTSDLSRAIRVAHSVKKTFILSIPGTIEVEKIKPDYLLYHRRKGGIETPDKGKPKYLMLAMNEEEKISGAYLAGAIEYSKEIGLDLMLAIIDRETSVTYYRVKRLDLKDSRYDYFELEWDQP